MKKIFYLLFICIFLVGCKTQTQEEKKEPEKVRVYLGTGSNTYDLKIIYDDDSLPILKFNSFKSDFIEVYDSRKFTIKVKRYSFEDYTSIYVNDFTKDETSWFLFYINGRFQFTKS